VRKAQIARVAVTKKATTENQMGIEKVPTCAGSPRIERLNCAAAIRANGAYHSPE